MKHYLLYSFSLILIQGLICCSNGNDNSNTSDSPDTPNLPKTKADYPNPAIDKNPIVDFNSWKIKNGKFYIKGKWQFLKIAKPLANLANASDVNKLISYLDTLKNKYYNTVELNCYWNYFDTDGDGIIDKSLKPLNDLITAIYNKGMYPCLGVETYAVGGGTIPDKFWTHYSDAYAVDETGKQVTDTEYGTGSKVVSIYHEGYRNVVHEFIKNLAKGIDTKKILYFETTVEPQYMGARKICYSENARKEYNEWRKQNNITDAISEMPLTFPMPDSFVNNLTWNKFRAQFLAKWVNDDAAAYRSIAGNDAYVAVDYLDAQESVQKYRDGDPVEFLTALTCANIIQINWTWNFSTNQINQKAYDRVLQVKKATNRDWVISEHMTFNGSDFSNFDDTILEKILENTLEQGTRFGWEFTNVSNNTNDSFSLYYDNWSPKRVIKYVDKYWGYWLNRVKQVEENK
jgi:hypothetical protein